MSYLWKDTFPWNFVNKAFEEGSLFQLAFRAFPLPVSCSQLTAFFSDRNGFVLELTLESELDAKADIFEII